MGYIETHPLPPYQPSTPHSLTPSPESGPPLGIWGQAGRAPGCHLASLIFTFYLCDDLLSSTQWHPFLQAPQVLQTPRQESLIS